MDNTKCDLAFSQDSLGTKARALAGRVGSQGNSEFKYFWVSAAPLLGIEYLEDGDHGLFISVATKPSLGLFLDVEQIIDE